MAQDKDSKHLRWLKITLVADVSDNAFHVSAVDYLRDGLGGAAQSIGFTHNDSNPEDIMFNEAMPQDISGIRLTGTIQA